MSIEALLAEIVTELRANTAALQELNQGRDAALEQLKGVAAGTTEPKTTRSRKAKEETPPAEKQPETPAATGTRTMRQVDTSDDGLRKLVGPWLQEDGLTTEDRAARGAALKAMLDHFGSASIAGEKSTLDDEQRYQATFYVARMIAGLPVDYSQDYDFDSDPVVGGAAAPAAADDLVG